MDISHHAIITRSIDPLTFSEPALSPEIEVRTTTIERFGVGEARTLITEAYQRPSARVGQCLIVRTTFITHEAQNALLKILEDPPVSTYFRFVLPPDFALLPTLASRFQTDDVVNPAEQVSNSEAFTVFLFESYAQRLMRIETKLKQKDIAWQRAVKGGLIAYLKSDQQNRTSALEYVARTLLTRGASNKMLLEAAALTLPAS